MHEETSNLHFHVYITLVSFLSSACSCEDCAIGSDLKSLLKAIEWKSVSPFLKRLFILPLSASGQNWSKASRSVFDWILFLSSFKKVHKTEETISSLHSFGISRLSNAGLKQSHFCMGRAGYSVPWYSCHPSDGLARTEGLLAAR